jgi:hypothetical protein
MLAQKRGLGVAPVPPKTAHLTRTARAAGTMPDRDEATRALIEQSNIRARPGFVVTITRRLQCVTRCRLRLNTSHTQKFGHSRGALEHGGRAKYCAVRLLKEPIGQCCRWWRAMQIYCKKRILEWLAASRESVWRRYARPRSSRGSVDTIRKPSAMISGAIARNS